MTMVGGRHLELSFHAPWLREMAEICDVGWKGEDNCQETSDATGTWHCVAAHQPFLLDKVGVGWEGGTTKKQSTNDGKATLGIRISQGRGADVF